MEYVTGVDFTHLQHRFIAVPHTAGSVVKAAAYRVPRPGVHLMGGAQETLPGAGALPPAQQQGQPWHAQCRLWFWISSRSCYPAQTGACCEAAVKG